MAEATAMKFWLPGSPPPPLPAHQVPSDLGACVWDTDVPATSDWWHCPRLPWPGQDVVCAFSSLESAPKWPVGWWSESGGDGAGLVLSFPSRRLSGDPLLIPAQWLSWFGKGVFTLYQQYAPGYEKNAESCPPLALPSRRGCPQTSRPLPTSLGWAALRDSLLGTGAAGTAFAR